MMVSLEAQPLLVSKIAEGHLRCSVCSNRFSQPKMLGCSHSFCLKCLEELKKTERQPSNIILCPLCGYETTLEETLADLPDNVRLCALMKEVSKQEQPLQGQPENLYPMQDWKLKAEIKKYKPKGAKIKWPEDIAVFSDNEILVRDKFKNQLISIKITPESSVIAQKLKIKYLLSPLTITVNKGEQLIALDEKNGVFTVKTFSREYQLLNQFSLNEVWNTDYIFNFHEYHFKLAAVDDDNLIALGSFVLQKVYLYTPDGTCLRTLPLPHEYMWREFAICKQRLIYINSSTNELISEDTDKGNKRFSFHFDPSRFGTRMSFMSVCCDSDGSIYVSLRFHTRDGHDEIHCFSRDCEYIGPVIQNCLAYNIAFTPNGDLVTTQFDAVKIYGRSRTQ